MSLKSIITVAILFSVSPGIYAQNYAWQTTTGPLVGRVMQSQMSYDSTLYLLCPADRFYSYNEQQHIWLRVQLPDTANQSTFQFSVNNRGDIYVRTKNLYRSTTGGSSWDNIHDVSKTNNEIAVTELKTHGWDDIYFVVNSTDPINWEPNYDIVYSRDNGAHWKGHHGWWNNFHISIGFFGTAYISDGYEIVKTDDPLTVWDVISKAPECTYDEIQFLSSRYPLIRSMRQGSEFIYSYDDGITWKGLPLLPAAHQYYDFEVMPDNTIVVAYALDGMTHLATTTTSDTVWTTVFSFPVQIDNLELGGENSLLIGTPRTGLFEFDLKTQVLSSLFYGYNTGTVPTVYASSNGTIYATDDNHCMYTTSIYAKTWKRLTTFIAEQPVKFIETRSGAVFANGFGVLRTTSNGERWDTVLNVGDTRYISTSPDGVLFAASADGVFQSKDDGDTWTTTPLPGFLAGKVNQYVDLGSTNRLICTLDGALYRSDDGGISWWVLTPVTDHVLRIVVGPSMEAYAITEEGQTWKAPYPGSFFQRFAIDTVLVRDIAFLGDSTTYIATAAGIIYSRDGGASWSRHDEGLPADDINTITPAPNGYIYAGLKDYGVYKAPTHLVSAPYIPEPRSFSLSPAYPNPVMAGQASTIELTTEVAGTAHLTLYNEAGMLVRECSQECTVGENTIRLNTAGLSPGAYRFSMSTGGLSDSQWIIIQ